MNERSILYFKIISATSKSLKIDMETLLKPQCCSGDIRKTEEGLRRVFSSILIDSGKLSEYDVKSRIANRLKGRWSFIPFYQYLCASFVAS